MGGEHYVLRFAARPTRLSYVATSFGDHALLRKATKGKLLPGCIHLNGRLYFIIYGFFMLSGLYAMKNIQLTVSTR
jgi:hypothetical protein